MPCWTGSFPVASDAWFGYVEDGSTDRPPFGAYTPCLRIPIKLGAISRVQCRSEKPSSTSSTSRSGISGPIDHVAVVGRNRERDGLAYGIRRGQGTRQQSMPALARNRYLDA